MKTDSIISIIVFIVVFLYIGHFRLSLFPFSISLPYWHRAVGVLLVIIGFIIYNVGEKASGYKEGLKNGSEIVWKVLKDKANNP